MSARGQGTLKGLKSNTANTDGPDGSAGKKRWQEANSRFRLVIVATLRAKQLLRGARPRIEADTQRRRNTSIALEEVRRALVPFTLTTNTGRQTVAANTNETDSRQLSRKPELSTRVPTETCRDGLMHKRIIDYDTQVVPSDRDWLDLERLARVEVSSEEDAFPIESALLPRHGAGWRAAQAGAQTIRLLFDAPQRLRQIWLVFNEGDRERTQEFVLKWSRDGGQSFQELLRQQWTFSPPGTTREIEDYRVDLAGVTVLELTIVPDISGGSARASLEQMRLS